MSGVDTINNDETMNGAARVLLAGRYRIVRQLGQGGMGSVWLAEDVKLDGRKVAIKMLPSILVSNKRAYAQVKQEALVSLKLTHPNIVAVRAFEEEGGNPFLVIDYIEGRTLDDYLAEKGKLTEEETVRILKPIAAALDYAHAQGVVHRDVKPGNVMIDGSGHPYVLDFGIAREVQETMTRVTGKLSSGTLMYMSPEQLHGAAPKPAQDVYSFAAMAYESLTGTPPFSRGQIEYQIEHDTPESLGEHIAICSQVMAGLAKSPEARPPTCAAVLEKDGKKSAQSAAGVSASGTRIAFVGSLLALAVIAGVGGWLWREKTRSDALVVERARQVEIANRKAAWRKTEATEQEVARLREKDVRIAKEKEIGQEGLKNVRPTMEDDLRHRNELRQLATLKTKIGIKIAEARANVEKAAVYRDEKDGFEMHLAEIDRQYALIDKDRSLDTLTAATSVWREVSDAADAISFELNWLAINREGRDAARRIAREIVDELEEPLRKYNADDVAKSTFTRGTSERTAAAETLKHGDFTAAKVQYETAKATLGQALQESRTFFVETAVSVAKEYRSAQKWQACLAEAQKALGCDPDNVNALSLKTEAEHHLSPTLRVVAKIGEREVRAPAVFGGERHELPWLLKDLSPGTTIPSADMAVECVEGDKRYVGAMKRQTVDWLGLKTVVIPLTEYKGPKPGATKTVTLPGGATMEFVWCPPGSFMMGSPETEDDRGRNETQHLVTLTQGFWMGKYEVTQRQWESVMGENPSSFKGADRPVEWVSWDDCQMFVRKVNTDGKVPLSLPTEAQWEYACRAGSTTPFSFGQTLNGDKANCDGNYPYGTPVRGCHRKETASVGSYAPNAWGLYDMHGNVLEWCMDNYGKYDGDALNSTGSNSGIYRVARGGGWDSYALRCRSASRSRYMPGLRDFYLGFRLVCSSNE